MADILKSPKIRSKHLAVRLELSDFSNKVVAVQMALNYSFWQAVFCDRVHLLIGKMEVLLMNGHHVCPENKGTDQSVVCIIVRRTGLIMSQRLCGYAETVKYQIYFLYLHKKYIINSRMVRKLFLQRPRTLQHEILWQTFEAIKAKVFGNCNCFFMTPFLL